FKVRLGQYQSFDYVLLIFSGLIPFIGFSEALVTGVSSVTENKSLIRNTLFPIELIPIKAVLSSSVTMLFGLAMLMTTLWLRGDFHLTQFMLPILLVLQLIFSMGLIWFLSAVNVFIPDLNQVIAIVVLFLMLVSPIAYTMDMIPK